MFFLQDGGTSSIGRSRQRSEGATWGSTNNRRIGLNIRHQESGMFGSGKTAFELAQSGKYANAAAGKLSVTSTCLLTSWGNMLLDVCRMYNKNCRSFDRFFFFFGGVIRLRHLKTIWLIERLWYDRRNSLQKRSMRCWRCFECSVELLQLRTGKDMGTNQAVSCLQLTWGRKNTSPKMSGNWANTATRMVSTSKHPLWVHFPKKGISQSQNQGYIFGLDMSKCFEEEIPVNRAFSWINALTWSVNRQEPGRWSHGGHSEMCGQWKGVISRQIFQWLEFSNLKKMVNQSHLSTRKLN